MSTPDRLGPPGPTFCVVGDAGVILVCPHGNVVVDRWHIHAEGVWSAPPINALVDWLAVDWPESVRHEPLPTFCTFCAAAELAGP